MGRNQSDSTLDRELYRLAYIYRKTDLWHDLYDSELFAVRLPGDETGYICVMGMEGYISLVVYVGDEGFQCYLAGRKSEFEMDLFEQDIEMCSHKCLQCVFENRQDLEPEELRQTQMYAKGLGVRLTGQKMYVHFTKYEPGKYPVMVRDAADKEILRRMLVAAIEVADLLERDLPESFGIHRFDEEKEMPLFEVEGDSATLRGSVPVPEEKKPVYASPHPVAEFTAGRLKRLPAKGTLDCRLARVIAPVMDEDPPYYPVLLFQMEYPSGKLVSHAIEKDYDPDVFLKDVTDNFVSAGRRPKKIRVCDDWTEALLKDFCAQTGIRYERVKHLPQMDTMYEGFRQNVVEGDSAQEDRVKEILPMLESLSPALLRTAPPDVREALLKLANDEGISESVRKRIRNVIRRAGWKK